MVTVTGTSSELVVAVIVNGEGVVPPVPMYSTVHVPKVGFVIVTVFVAKL